MLDLVISDDAEDDLLKAYHWYQAKQHGLGDRFLNSVQDGLNLIRRHPKIFPVSIVECRRALISKFPFEIIYEKKENRIVVYSVFNCSQHPAKWQSRVTGEQ